MACIYCHRQPPDVVLTREHIFPEALGAKLVLDDAVCKNCNDELGRFVDHLLSDSPLVQWIRFWLRVPGKEGKVRTTLDDITVPEAPGRTGTYELAAKAGDKSTIHLHPQRTPMIDADGRPVDQYIATPQEIEHISETLRKRWAKRGKKVRMTNTGETIIRSPRVVKETTSGLWGVIQVVPPLLKIGYELGVLWFGPSYLHHVYGRHLGESLRTRDLKDVGARVSYFVPDADSAFRGSGIPSWYHGARLQLTNGELWVIVRIFNIIEAAVFLSNASDFPDAQLQWVVLNPLQGSVHSGVGDVAVESLPDDEQHRLDWERTAADAYRVAVKYGGHHVGSVTVELNVGTSVVGE